MSQASRFGSLLVGLGCGGILGLYLAQNYDVHMLRAALVATLQLEWFYVLPDLHTLSEKLFAKTTEYKKDDKKK